MEGKGLRHYIYNSLFEENIRVCNETVLSKPAPEQGVYCPPVIDEWGSCFNYTKAGTTGFAGCPLLFGNPQGFAFRRCDVNGEWEIVSHGKAYTNMSACVQNSTLIASTHGHHEAVGYVYLYIANASLSLVLLTVSLAILFGFRQLRCDRITIHKNLFVSYVLTAVVWILYYRLAVLDGVVLMANPVWCQLLHILGQMFAAANFSWMFCEGLYLHIILEHAFRTGKTLIKCLVVGGWVVPILLTGTYGTVRWKTSNSTHSCWIEEDVSQWIVAGPIAFSVVINICILINLVRLLTTKLRQIPDASQKRKTAKATLILVPLLGLQFLVFPVSPQPDTKMYIVYLYVMAFLKSSQGTLVSIIFCFCNGEVRSILRRKWSQRHSIITVSGRKNTGLTSSTCVDGYSMVDSTRDGSYMKSKFSEDNHHKNIEALEMKANPVATTPLVQNDNGVEIIINYADDSTISL